MTTNTIMIPGYGVPVLVKDNGRPFHFANHTQAAAKVAAVQAANPSAHVWVSARRPFYVLVESPCRCERREGA